MKNISIKQLKEILSYDQESGLFTWKMDVADHVKAGYVAGCKTKIGYVTISIKRNIYKAHRLAWFYVYGEWPEYIDHINGNPSDNRIDNLRDVSLRENSLNKKLDKRNTTGLCGVTWVKRDNKWYVRISSVKKRLSLGYYNDFFEACCARKSAERRHGYHENNGRVEQENR